MGFSQCEDDDGTRNLDGTSWLRVLTARTHIIPIDWHTPRQREQGRIKLSISPKLTDYSQ